MATNHQPASAARVTISHANDNVTASVTRPVVTVPLAAIKSPSEPGQHPLPGPSPPPVFDPPSTQHDLHVIGLDFMQPTLLLFTELNLTVTVSESKALHNGTVPLSPSLQDGLSRTPDEHGLKLHVGAPVTSFQLNESDQLGDANAANRGASNTGPTANYCATIASPASKRLHFHLNPDGKMHRWAAEDGPIPISINLESFKSDKHGNKQGPKVQKCLENVLRWFNDIQIGPQFVFVQEPSKSAFFVTYGSGHADELARAFFPGSPHQDWYIYVYDLGLELDEGQLTRVLTHEMGHVMGLRHCYINPARENEPYVRHPRGISDHENWDPLMLPWPTLNEISGHIMKPKTVEDLRAIYAFETGQLIDGYEIRDVSWRVGAENRRKIARNNAC